MTRRRDFDWLAVVLVVLFSVLGLVLGVRDDGTADVDQVVYERTLSAMHDGQGYYPAMRDALVAKEGAAPSQLRSVRPPTMFEPLALLPPGSAWRWASAVAQLATLLLAWRIGRSRWPAGGPLAVGAVALWILGAAPLLYLHAELWGLPFALAGVLAMRRERWAWAAVAFGAATCVRELFAIFLVVGLLAAPRRRAAWAASLTVVAGLLGLHWWRASAILDPAGREAAFGKDRGLSVALSSLSPADRPAAWAIGLAGAALGLWALWALARDPGGAAERVVLASCLVLLVVTLVWGRAYWGLTFGPLLAVYAAMAPSLWRGRARALAGALADPAG